jgi:hypothetical protein
MRQKYCFQLVKIVYNKKGHGLKIMHLQPSILGLLKQYFGVRILEKGIIVMEFVENIKFNGNRYSVKLL